MKKTIALILALLCLLSVAGCGKSKPVEVTATISEDEKYNAAWILLTPEEFEKAGFHLGDSCDVEFQNGYSLSDVPYYNGYYVKKDCPVIVAYPGYPNINITINPAGIWNKANLSENDKVTIRLNEAGKYSAIHEVMGQEYSFARSDYGSTEQFCNFREVSGGNLKDGLLFRGTSPVNCSVERAKYTDELISAAGINFALNLADSEEDMAGYLADEAFDSPYALDLYNTGRIAVLDLSADYRSETYRQKVATGMKAMLRASGPIYIHCQEGKDRTGFVCMLLEALAGSSYDEMISDYMKTYENYFSITAEKTPDKFNSIADLYFNSFLSYLHGTEDTEVLKNADYVQDAANYLTDGGMTSAEVEQLREFITK